MSAAGLPTRSITSPLRSATVARRITPASTPTTDSDFRGAVTCGGTSSTWKTASSLFLLRLTVTFISRAPSRSTSLCNWRVFSWTSTLPTRDSRCGFDRLGLSAVPDRARTRVWKPAVRRGGV